MKYIEDILFLNTQISNRVLIFNKLNWKTKLLSILLIILGILNFVIFIYYLFPKPNLSILYLLIPLFLLGIASTILNRISTQKIIEKHYNYSIKKGQNWNYKTILKIRKKELIKKLKNDDLLEKENLIFLIESIKYHKQNRYKMSFLWNSVIILVSVLFGGYLSGQTSFSENSDSLLNLYKNFAIGIGILIIIIMVVDNILIRDFIESKKNLENRLIRTLENIYIEKYAT